MRHCTQHTIDGPAHMPHGTSCITPHRGSRSRRTLQLVLPPPAPLLAVAHIEAHVLGVNLGAAKPAPRPNQQSAAAG
eukprot:1567510-Prymnesium_polylepis.1